jgi:predicted nucleic acid-binding protein
LLNTCPLENAKNAGLPDFLEAAHAATQADSLATEDRGCLRAYFPQIRILSPAIS